MLTALQHLLRQMQTMPQTAAAAVEQAQAPARDLVEEQVKAQGQQHQGQQQQQQEHQEQQEQEQAKPSKVLMDLALQ